MTSVSIRVARLQFPYYLFVDRPFPNPVPTGKVIPANVTTGF